jgi:uncharacterized protein YjiK
MNYCMERTFTCLLIVLLALTGCKISAAENGSGSLKGYDLNKPEKFVMPGSLLEISGIAFNHGISDVIYAIQDEEGKFFRLSWGVKKQVHWKFAKSGDYEDVALLHDRVVVLKSNGTLYTFNVPNNMEEEIEDVQEWKKLLPPGEYESLYADEASSQLYTVCKNCKQDKDKEGVSGVILRYDDSVYTTGTFFIDAAAYQKLEGKEKKGLRPSALARNPVTQEWYLLSSVHKLLLIIDEQWRIKETVKLSANTFNQPEGIAFDRAGNLYISNEGDDVTEGNILKFSRKP